MSLIIDSKRISSNSYPYIPEKSAVTEQSEQIKKDASEISNSSKEISSFPFDFSQSIISKKDDTYNFNLEFNKSESLRFSAGGFFSQKSSTFKINFNFIFEQKINGENGIEIKRYNANFIASGSLNETFSINKKTEKEDIYKFLNRVMKQINEVMADDEKSLAGIQFSDEDLKDLYSIDNKEIGKLLNGLFTIIKTAAQLKKMQLKKNLEEVILRPEREVNNSLVVNSNKNSEIKLELNLEEIKS